MLAEPLALHLAPGVRAALTTRVGGASAAPYESLNVALHVGDDPAAVIANRATAALSVGVDPARVTWAEQVHGATVGHVTAADVGRGSRALVDAFQGCDAMVTTEADVPLAVVAADCVPLVLADRGGGPVAAVHAGRPGLLAGVVGATVSAMVALGADPADLVAASGPAIGPCCYEVGEDVHASVVAVFPSTAARSSRDRASLDLHAGVDSALAAAGVAPAARHGGCTACDAARWYSYRRDGVTGRHAAIVWRQG